LGYKRILLRLCVSYPWVSCEHEEQYLDLH
jgi:hypothetical protein